MLSQADPRVRALLRVGRTLQQMGEYIHIGPTRVRLTTTAFIETALEITIGAEQLVVDRNELDGASK